MQRGSQETLWHLLLVFVRLAVRFDGRRVILPKSRMRSLAAQFNHAAETHGWHRLRVATDVLEQKLTARFIPQ